MKKQNIVYNVQGISMFTLLGIVFITLKLCSVITWSWWWVLAPFYVIPLVVVLLLISTIVIFAFIAK